MSSVRKYEPRGDVAADKRPILFVPGWGMDDNASKEFAQRVANASGQSVFTFEYDPQFRVGRGPNAIINAKALMVLRAAHEVQTMTGVDVLDVIGYSEGCLVALYAKEMSKGVFGRFSLIAPAGVNPSMGYLGIAFDAVRNALQNFLVSFSLGQEDKQRIKTHKRSCGQWMKTRGRIRALFEGMAPGRIDAIDLYRKLAGCRIAFFLHDIMVPAEPETAQILEVAGAQVRVLSDAGHFGFYTKQEKLVRTLFPK